MILQFGMSYDRKLTLRQYWYFVPEALFFTILVVRIIVSILSTRFKLPGCTCFYAAALYIDAQVPVSPQQSLLSKIPRFLSAAYLIPALLCVGLSFMEEMQPPRKMLAFVLVALASFLATVQHSHYVCHQFYRKLLVVWLARGGEPTHLEDVIVHHQPVDVSPYRTILTEEMRTSTTECPICSDPFQDGNVSLLPCEHFYHEVCAETWLRRVPSCPLCRRSVVVTPLPED